MRRGGTSRCGRREMSPEKAISLSRLPQIPHDPNSNQVARSPCKLFHLAPAAHSGLVPGTRENAKAGAYILEGARAAVASPAGCSAVFSASCPDGSLTCKVKPLSEEDENAQ